MALDLAAYPNVRTQIHYGITWIDVHAPDKELLDQLERLYHLHPVHAKESIQKVQHYQVERSRSYLFVVLHFLMHGTRAKAFSDGQLGIFIGKEYVLTIHMVECPLVARLFAEFHTHDSTAFEQGSAYIAYLLIKAVLDDITATTETLLANLDRIERLVFDDNVSDAQPIAKLRQEIVRLKRIIGPKKLLLQDLTEQIGAFAGPSLVPYYSYNVKSANRLWEVVEEANESTTIYNDVDYTLSTERTNQTLAILTLIFTFTIPVSVLSALYGMNVPLPGGLSNGAWTFFGPYTMFGFIVGTSVAAALGMYLYFRHKGWM